MESLKHDPTVQMIGAVFFALAILHTFSVKLFEKIAHHYKEGSVGENFWHFMSEVEAVFGFWAALLVLAIAVLKGGEAAIHYVDTQNYIEPVFVFVIMSMAATRPVIMLAGKTIEFISKIIPAPRKMAFYISALIFGPLLGSFITEPAAMTVTALILLKYFYRGGAMSEKFKYATIGLLFVNVSIGGTLTHFAAPPVLMVASKFGWDMKHMILNFGFKSAIAIFAGTVLTAIYFRKELQGELPVTKNDEGKMNPTWWMYLMHIIFLGLVVKTAHHMAVFMGIFLFFLGFVVATKEYQEELKLKDALMVGFFLGGLVTLGTLQEWWLGPIIKNMGDMVLYYGATALTAVTDNAALTFLGAQVENLSESAKYYLVAGAVTGGGLTVIANAPNPAGYGILKNEFKGGMGAGGLFLGALIPTILAILCLGYLPSL